MITSECLAEKGDFVVCVDLSPPFSIGIYQYESITINKKYEVLVKILIGFILLKMIKVLKLIFLVKDLKPKLK